jgi:hypothetical protein
MPKAKVFLSLKPGDVLVVGPQGHVTLAIDESDALVVEVVGCMTFPASVRNAALTDIRNMVFDSYDDTGTRRVVGDNGGASNG